jgi:hypothetical protein
MKSMTHPLAAEFEFAGFTFPKWVWNLPRGSMQQRLESAKNPVTSGYYHAPKPIREDRGMGFYLDEKCGPFALRWKWSDEVVNLRHKGWLFDKFQSETIRGLVMRLPSGRGFLAGWSMGENMASGVGARSYETEREAAYAADREAELIAEQERESAEKNKLVEAEAIA